MKKWILEGILLTFFSILALGAQAVTISETHTNITCYGGNGGSINITVTGGTAPYTYAWADGPTVEDRTNLIAGTYTVLVTDFIGATAQRTINVTQGADMVTSKTVTPVSCGGGNDGAINFNVSGTNPPFSFLWSDGNTNEDRLNITAANYYVTITDGIGCTKIDSANVIQPMGMVPSTLVTDANCNASNGHIDLTVQYGYPPYSYVWNDGNNNEDRVSLSMGTYSVTITDSINCQVSATATVNQANETLNIGSTSTNPTCNGAANGVINITAVTGGAGPFTYYWSDSSTQQNHTGLTAGNYTVTVTSSHACTATKSFTLTQPAALGITLTPVHVQCYGGSNGAINTAVTGGTTPYTYNWGSGVTVQNRTGLTAGTYTVTVTDNKGCTITASTTINQPTQLVVTTTTTPIACTGGNTAAVYTNVTGGTGAGSYSYWWGGANFSANRVNIGAGTYTVTVTDANNCTATASSTINSYIPLNVNRTVTNASCAGSNNGAIDVNVSNGWLPYAYTWSNSAVTQDINGLAPATYSCTVSDNHLCSVTVSGTVTQPASSISINATVSNISCNGSANGSINLAPTGGSTPYNYNWGSGIVTQNRTMLTVGNYNVVVTDNNNCTVAGSYNITEPAALDLTTTVTNATCNGAVNGAIDLTVTGGTTGYTYHWNNNAATQDITNVAAGNYNVTVTDNNLCTATATATITEPAAATLNITKGDVTCNGVNNGFINVTPSVPGAYTYNWGNNITAQNRTNLSAGTYSVTADNGSCQLFATVTITQPTAVAVTSTVTNVKCNGGNDGAISITANGGAGTYTYTWSGNYTGTQLNSLTSGAYQVTVSDAANCSASANINVTQPNAININSTVINTRCYGQSNGRINLAVTGGATPYNYLWSTGNTGISLVSRPAGTYTVTVTDNNNCTAVKTDSIGNAPAMGLNLVTSNISCYGGNNGGIDLTANGGTGAYTYNWSNSTTAEDLANATAGQYNVTVTDANNCTVTATRIITAPAPITITESHTDIACSNSNTGSITIGVSGGTGTYNYTWSNNAHTQNLTNISGGTYTVTVTDGNNCSATSQATLTQSNPVMATETHNNVTCYGGNNGNINVTATGGNGTYFYQWSTTATTQNLHNITANNYSVTIADGNNCKDTLDIIITQPAAIQLTTTVTNAGCSGAATGAVILTTNGGNGTLHFNWSNNSTSQNLNNLAPGFYTVTATDGINCTATATASVTQALPIAVSFTTTNATCFGGNNGAITGAATGGSTGAYIYNWSTGATTNAISNVTAGTYTLTVTDGNNCQSINNVTVGQAAAIQITETHTSAQCNNAASASITVNAQNGAGGYQYHWNTGDTATTLSNLVPNNYTVTVTDANQCSAAKTINVVQAAAVSLTETHNDYACASQPGSINLTVTGGISPYNFNWGNNITTEDRSQLTQGNYMVTVTDQGGCSASKVINIGAAPMLNSSLQKTDAGCYGQNNGSVQLNVTGGTAPYSFAWSNNAQTQNIDHLYAGNYNVNITDARGCTTSNSTSIAQNAALQVNNYVEPVKCFGGNNGSINITVTGGLAPYNYQWTNGSQNEDNLQLVAGTYSVTVMDAMGCKALNENLQVTQPAAINIQSNVVSAGCVPGSTGSASVAVTGGVPPYAFYWSTNDTVQEVNDLAAGTYIVTVTDKLGCPASRSVTIDQLQAIQINSTVQNTPCAQQQNGAIALNVSGGLGDYTYNWNNNGTTSSLTNLGEGTYAVTVSDISGCTGQASINVTHDYDLTVDASNYVTIAIGESTELTATASINHSNIYSWTPNMLMSCNNCASTTVSPNSTTTYTVNVVDINGCTASDTVTVEVNSVSNVFIPNAFSPNNDGANDVFTMYGDNGSLRYLEIMIFNRWGEKIFESNNHNFIWDGTYKGEVVEQGVYIYTANMVFSNGEKKEYKGSVLVLK